MKLAIRNVGILLCGALVLIANVATTSSSLCFWHEPDCPEELIKR